MAIKKLKAYIYDDKGSCADEALELAAKFGFEEYSDEYEAIYDAIHQHEVELTIEFDTKTLMSRVVRVKGDGWSFSAPEEKAKKKKVVKKKAKRKALTIKKKVVKKKREFK